MGSGRLDLSCLTCSGLQSPFHGVCWKVSIIQFSCRDRVIRAASDWHTVSAHMREESDSPVLTQSTTELSLLGERQWPRERCRDTEHLQKVGRVLLAGLEMQLGDLHKKFMNEGLVSPGLFSISSSLSVPSILYPLELLFKVSCSPGCQQNPNPPASSQVLNYRCVLPSLASL